MSRSVQRITTTKSATGIVTDIFGKGLTKDSLRRLTHEKSEEWWVKEGEKRALALFHEAAKRVPAYASFLKKKGVKASAVRSMTDFSQVPETDKKNYITRYPLEDRCWDGTLKGSTLVAMSSGTTGSPTLWPRGMEQEAEAALVHEHLFLDLYEVKRYRTLAIIAFPMGVYVSGIATTLPSFLTACKHPNLTLLTAGNNRDSILKTLTQLQKDFDQVILIGHPFFIKDVIETGKKHGIRWGKTKLRTMFCSEGFSEEWRDYISSLVLKSASHRDFFNTYGSSELLLMAYESPETVLLRRASEKDSELRNKLFSKPVTPFLFQYNPSLRYIESNSKGELLFTARSGVPLVRFNLHDSGELISHSFVNGALKETGISLTGEIRKAGWKRWNLPFVALYGRSDHALVFYAANIYPEHIHGALNHAPFLKKITGKFSMEKNYTPSMDQRLTVHIELQEKESGTASLCSELRKNIVQNLEAVNMEYLFLRNNLEKDLVPEVVLHPYQDDTYFKQGIKPRYIIK
ncbi:MAG: hypothetical protein V4449_03060 [Patescibacteria group bacterium]